MKVFVYATLKSKATQERALGHDAKILGQASAQGWKEVQLEGRGGPWPTLEQANVGTIHGEIFELTAGEVNKLDRWEDRYSRELIKTDRGPAWAYFYRRWE
jgi:gamma-glutamylcyclotransferase (GGCT)/AIG2-like uncharacterized protein YtfP